MYKNYKNAEFAGNCGTEQRRKEHFVRMMNYKFQQKQDFKRPKYNVPLNIIETEEEFETLWTDWVERIRVFPKNWDTSSTAYFIQRPMRSS